MVVDSQHKIGGINEKMTKPENPTKIDFIIFVSLAFCFA